MLEIGDNCILAPGCKILAHDDSPKIFREPSKVAKTIIGNNCFIGCNAVILPGVRLGNYVIVGAGAVVTKSFIHSCILVGNPAHELNKE
jgi:maltose O-acetyltransferase